MPSHTGQMRSRSGPGVVPLAVALLLLLASCALQDTVAPNDASGARGISADRSAGPAPDFYVSPTGSPSGDGSFTEPWDLATALASPAAVTPGSTIWLRGGMYTNAADPRGFASTLMGTPDAPILVRQYPGERATVTNILFVTGAYTWFWGFEVTNPAPQQGVMHGVHLKGPGIKVINLVVHDATDDGIFIGPEASGAEVNGSILYNNGRTDNLSHGIYCKSQTGTLLLKDNIVFDNWAYGFHCYAKDGPYIQNIDLRLGRAVGCRHSRWRHVSRVGNHRQRELYVPDELYQHVDCRHWQRRRDEPRSRLHQQLFRRRVVADGRLGHGHRDGEHAIQLYRWRDGGSPIRAPMQLAHLRGSRSPCARTSMSRVGPTSSSTIGRSRVRSA